jgi:hypothetical protein
MHFGKHASNHALLGTPSCRTYRESPARLLPDLQAPLLLLLVPPLLLLLLLPCYIAPHLLHIWLLEEALEEGVGVAEAPAVDDVTVCDEAIAPIEAKHVLASACMGTHSEAQQYAVRVRADVHSQV